MICTLTARRLKSGAYDEFRAAWGGGSERPEGTERWRRVYHCRDVEDANVVISFGFFEGTLEELRDAQQSMARESQVSGVDPYVQEILLDGSYEVIEELT